MDYDILKSVSQGSDGAQDAENSRIKAITDELRRRCELYEAQRGDSQPHVSPFEIEQRVVEAFAKEHGLWIPMDNVLDLGTTVTRANRMVMMVCFIFLFFYLLLFLLFEAAHVIPTDAA
jgi:hypothetical protein